MTKAGRERLELAASHLTQRELTCCSMENTGLSYSRLTREFDAQGFGPCQDPDLIREMRLLVNGYLERAEIFAAEFQEQEDGD